MVFWKSGIKDNYYRRANFNFKSRYFIGHKRNIWTLYVSGRGQELKTKTIAKFVNVLFLRISKSAKKGGHIGDQICVASLWEDMYSKFKSLKCIHTKVPVSSRAYSNYLSSLIFQEVFTISLF